MSEPNPVGRPTDYRPEMCQQVIDLGKEGKSKAQIAAALGKSRQTLENWSAEYPDFLDALKIARDLALAWWEDKGQECLTAEKFQQSAFIFQMKNRFREDYRDSHEHSGPEGGAIPIRLSSLSDAQLEQLLKRLEAG